MPVHSISIQPSISGHSFMPLDSAEVSSPSLGKERRKEAWFLWPLVVSMGGCPGLSSLPSFQSACQGLGGEVGGAYGWRCPEPQALNSLLTGFLGKWVGLHTSTFPLL